MTGSLLASRRSTCAEVFVSISLAYSSGKEEKKKKNLGSEWVDGLTGQRPWSQWLYRHTHRCDGIPIVDGAERTRLTVRRRGRHATRRYVSRHIAQGTRVLRASVKLFESSSGSLPWVHIHRCHGRRRLINRRAFSGAHVLGESLRAHGRMRCSEIVHTVKLCCGGIEEVSHIPSTGALGWVDR